ncbi:hypothetical protein EVAR_95193_1 [Eumeta japonica]|uniref:Uncharacterized protein n=1 Tax=Eumeta variegata TaxID=151549 RepID=A0A4C1VIF5_EUMVA|nr:hypothetical protein EVAR_95193_1 [Eumeta japonica]
MRTSLEARRRYVGRRLARRDRISFSNAADATAAHEPRADEAAIRGVGTSLTLSPNTTAERSDRPTKNRQFSGARTHRAATRKKYHTAVTMIISCDSPATELTPVLIERT